MRRLIKLFMLLLICLILSSCNSKEEYKLVEITSHDFLVNMNNKKDFVFAFVNENTADNKAFMKDLENIVNKTHINVYYIDYNHMDYESFASLVDSINLVYNKSSYYVYKDKSFVVSERYSNYQNMYKALKNYTLTNKLDITSDDELKNNFNKAKEEYDNGNIGNANNYLNLSWTLQEAKDFYQDHELFKILHRWENYEFTNPEKLDYTTYRSIFFPTHSNQCTQASKSGLYENFVKPDKLEEYEFLYYYIKDDIIYTAKSEKTERSDYKATYKINSITDQLLSLTDLKNNKEYEYIRGV